jgi:protein-L-isoaspartate(D-aspartate) O-methyltransferase
VKGVEPAPASGMPKASTVSHEPATAVATIANVATAPATGPAHAWTPPTFADRRAERDRMVDYIASSYDFKDNAVLQAIATVPRHEFVPAEFTESSYDDKPLPIPNGQLISQPWIVSEMTHQLKLTPASRVLEIGTGSGYQAAVLTHFTEHVYSIEIIRPLAEAAAERLKRLGYTPVNLRIGDGFEGWAEAGPFDAIIVTCAAGQIPPPLIKQLAPGGRMVIPVGNPFAMQSLMLVEKDPDGTVRSQSLAPVRFVPLLAKDPTAP